MKTLRPAILLKDSTCWPPEGIPGLTGDETCLVLTKGYVSLIDAEDAIELQQHRWWAQVRPGRVCALRTYRDGSATYLHREVLKPPQDMFTDHVDQHRLFKFRVVDNRRENLRTVTDSQNLANSRKRRDCSSTYKGVGWYAPSQKWQAKIGVNGQQKHLGYFDNEIEAANAYDAAHALHYPGIPEGTNAHMMNQQR